MRHSTEEPVEALVLKEDAIREAKEDIYNSCSDTNWRMRLEPVACQSITNARTARDGYNVWIRNTTCNPRCG